MDQTQWSESHSMCKSESFSAVQRIDLKAEARDGELHLMYLYIQERFKVYSMQL